MRAITMAVLCLALLVPGTAEAQRSKKSTKVAETYNFQVCNKSSHDDVYVAIATYRHPEDEHWIVEGWWTLDRGDCQTWTNELGDYSTHTIAYYAETDDVEWSGNHGLCVTNDEFERENTDSDSCLSDEHVVQFTTVKVGPGLTTEDLVD